MKYYFSLLCLVAFSINGLAQLPTVNLCLGTDATVCQGQPVVITDCNPGGGGPGTNAIVLTNPINVSLSDDQWSSVVPIGFTFNFYGNNFTQCVIGSNGLISFNLGNANGYCPWSTAGAGPLPTTGLSSAMNAVSLSYSDLLPPAGGFIRYQTLGTAPNRQFIVLYENIPAYAGNGTCNYMALILNETSNNVEFYIAQKQLVATWNSGCAIQAVENSAGNIASATPGRNNTQWAATMDGKIVVPTAPSNTSAYTISTTTYKTIFASTTSSGWSNTLGQNFPYNGGVLNINTVPPGTTGYFVNINGNGCSGSIGAASDTTWITRVNSSVSATSTPDICTSGIGTATATPGAGIAPFTYNWPALGQTTQTVTNVPAGTYTVQMTDGNGCPSTANVTVGDTPASFNGTTTIVSCPGGTDGTATANMVPVLGTITYQWDDPAMQTTQTAVGLAAGTYNCVVTSTIGCTGTVTVTVTEIPGMIATIANQTDVTCNSGNDGMIELSVAQGTGPYSYMWDNSTSIANIASDLFVGNHTATVTDANGCVVTVNGTLGQPNPLSITALTPVTQICPEDDIQLDVVGSGGSSAYTFTWSENGTIIGTGTSITVDPQFTNTQYCVTLSEACGSPTHDSCTVINFPVPIVASITPDHVEDCIPGFFEFTNSSSNGGEIATTYFEFSDGNSYMEIGNDSTSNLFTVPNFYSANMTITSIYGCVYTGTFNNLIEVKPLPVADFTFSSNPATFFETAIQLQDRSSADVIDWNWISPGSNPSYSMNANPAFTFPEGEIGDYPVTLIVTTEYGCTDTVTYIMHIVQDVIFYAPNTFTPDNDEHNQTWEIFVSGIDIYHFDLFIFNRWGEVIWESHDASAKWDGTYNGEPVPAGTYIWKASAKDSLNDGKYEFNGYINVLK